MLSLNFLHSVFKHHNILIIFRRLKWKIKEISDFVNKLITISFISTFQFPIKSLPLSSATNQITLKNEKQDQKKKREREKQLRIIKQTSNQQNPEENEIQIEKGTERLKKNQNKYLGVGEVDFGQSEEKNYPQDS